MKIKIGVILLVLGIAAVLYWNLTEDNPEPVALVMGQEEDCRLIAIAINDIRKKHSLAPLKVSPVLNTAAKDHAKNMAKQNKLDHVLDRKGPAERITKLGYNWTWCAENIAWNQRSVEQVMEGWMNSPGHRKNILSPSAEELGIGIVLSTKQEPYYCTVFAKPAKGN